MLGERILIVCAHPDDDILGCAGVMAKLRKRGAAVRVMFLGEGSSCRYTPTEHEGLECQSAIALKQLDARAALAMLDVNDIVFRKTKCGRFDMTPLIDIGKLVESEIADFRPDTVLTHSFVDANNDHKVAFQATLQATRPGALNNVSTVISFEILSSTEWAFVETFKPNYFVSIEAEIEAKLDAMAKYTTETRPFPFPRSAEGIRALAMLRGTQAGVKFAEAFQVVRSISK